MRTDGTDDGAQLGGRLLTLVGERDFHALAPAISQIAHDESDRSAFTAVVTWMVTTIADLIADPTASVDDAVDSFISVVPVVHDTTEFDEELPPPAEWLFTAVVRLLQSRHRTGSILPPPVPADSALTRTQALVEALLWLDALLDRGHGSVGDFG
ncbi:MULTISPECIES: hypothetical protein [unclassified Rhodococcus (in: high G+C Gram-positive bacteria)]|uniref:hypothetical protein n=1 Tax=unclassified Rhodococcus (in: high G+C Gram-positive bacteria) TaxID=192944 RepID=UPI00163973DA|nr:MULTISPECIES: hypothetical protein [unclassified Rhodococcus (in: high G+C Gram-positive bacteria)]MBC2641275.1 hypothetical protein [Rhodococcus sp. 3A]MBC2893980.1 hypothetical protein [Rhodococcus sp. 4CII]